MEAWVIVIIVLVVIVVLFAINSAGQGGQGGGAAKRKNAGILGLLVTLFVILGFSNYIKDKL